MAVLITRSTGKTKMKETRMNGLSCRVRRLQGLSCDQLSRQGKLIVIEGTDGSGKATYSNIVFERLKNEGYAAELVDFPQYGKPSAVMIEKYLRGELGTPEEVGPHRASTYYAKDRKAKSKDLKTWLGEGKIILCNRYTTSNMGHQAGKIKDRIERDKFLDWLVDLEYNKLKIPKPDKVIFLHMPPEIGQKLVESKGKRDYINGKKKDAHESDLNHLKDAEESYLYVAKKYGWLVIEVSDGKKPYSIEENAKKVYRAVKEAIK
jgi:thymidylate kinase